MHQLYPSTQIEWLISTEFFIRASFINHIRGSVQRTIQIWESSFRKAGYGFDGAEFRRTCSGKIHIPDYDEYADLTMTSLGTARVSLAEVTAFGEPTTAHRIWSSLLNPHHIATPHTGPSLTVW
jgi:hypothetical protein